MKIQKRSRALRLVLGGSLLALWATVGASPAAASVVVGQVAPTTPTPTCAAPVDRVQPTVTTGPSYLIPTNGTITSWSTNAGASAGELKLKVFHLVTGTTYQAVAQDGPRALTINTLNTFSANVPVKAGDLIGLNSFSGTPNCSFVSTGNTYLRTLATSDLANGQSADFPTPVADRLLNISAVVEPTNTITFGAVVKNKKKGTATVTVNVPNTGQVAFSGNKVKIANSGVTTVNAVGSVTYTLKAKGKKLTKLNTRGKVKVNPSFTFTPTGGTAKTQSIQVTLKKNE
jgi:VCBS repeat-containing protein